jgi:hypothetical protein
MIFHNSFSFLVSVSALFSLVVAQNSSVIFDPSLCKPDSGVTFTACNAFQAALDNCTAEQTDQGLTDCMCTQTYFNLIFKYA